jgi:hypothetical protein
MIIASDLDKMKRDFFGLNVDTSKRVLKTYQVRKDASTNNSSFRPLPQLHE